MNKIFFTILTTITAVSALASDSYEDGDTRAIQACLHHWGKHPFNAESPEFKTLSAKVKVLGIGGDIMDEVVTPNPQLVLVKPNVNVLSKAMVNLDNPNGWYCLKANVAVLGKTVINLACKANLASSKDGATVLGGDDSQGGVTVLGASRVYREKCHGN